MEALYKYVVPKPKSQCSKTEQLGVSFVAGYIAGVFCAVVSHPADNLVSKLNSQKGATIGSIVNEMGWRAPPAAPCAACPVLHVAPARRGALVGPRASIPRRFQLSHDAWPAAYHQAACGTRAACRPAARSTGRLGRLTLPLPARRAALFTRGLPLRIVMIGTLTGLQWGIYDAFKVYVGLCAPPAASAAWPAAPLLMRRSCLRACALASRHTRRQCAECAWLGLIPLNALTLRQPRMPALVPAQQQSCALRWRAHRQCQCQQGN